MLNFFRTHQRIAQLLLLIFIVPSFVFVGVQGYSSFSNDGNVVAKVAGYKITQEEWDAAQRDQVQRMRKVLGKHFDAKIFESAEFKNDVLDDMIVKRAIAAEIVSRNMMVPDHVLQKSIMSIRGLTKEDGSFDHERYKSLLKAQGYTEAGYEAGLRHDLTMQQVRSAIPASAFVPKTVANRISGIAAQTRDVAPLLIKSADFLSKVMVTDAMLEDYYRKHAAQFEVPEQMKAEYVVLDMDAVKADISVSDADVKSYYEQNAKRYETPEQRRASHILIKMDKAASAAEKATAKAKAEEILKQLQQNPASFSALAKQHSQDPGSASKGGDLGYFGKGMMVKPFENEVFKLKNEALSGLVATDFGYHIIKLTGVKPSATKPMNDVRAEIVDAIKRQLLSKKFAEAAEIFTNTVYEHADSLQPVAKALNLEIKTVSGLTRKGGVKDKDAPYNQEKFLNALFSDEVIKNKLNSEAVEVGQNTLISGRVVGYMPKSVKPFDEVKSYISEQVKLAAATVMATKDGEEKLAKLQQGGNVTGFGSIRQVSRAAGGGTSPELLRKLMSADVSKLPAYVGMELPMHGYGIYRITGVATPKIEEARREAEARQISNLLAQQEMLAYLEALKVRVKTEIIKPAKAAAKADKE